MQQDRVLLNSMIGKMPDTNNISALYEDDKHSIYWLGTTQQTTLHGNAYLIVNEDEAILVDPGGKNFFTQVYDRVLSVVDPNKITCIILCHQDPDVAASITDWLKICPDVQIISNPHTHSLLPHYGEVDYNAYDAEKEYHYTFKSGKSLLFIPAPFLHSPCAFTTFDETSGFLFSGDIWASLDIDKKIVVDKLENHIYKMDLYHKDIMASNAAAKYFVHSISELDIQAILPQHGSIITQKDVKASLEYLEKLECGTDLLYAVRESFSINHINSSASDETSEFESEFKEIFSTLEEIKSKLSTVSTTEDSEKNILLRDALKQSTRVTRIRDKSLSSLKATKEALKKAMML